MKFNPNPPLYMMLMAGNAHQAMIEGTFFKICFVSILRGQIFILILYRTEVNLLLSLSHFRMMIFYDHLQPKVYVKYPFSLPSTPLWNIP